LRAGREGLCDENKPVAWYRMQRRNPVATSSPAARAAARTVLALWVGCLGFAQAANAEVRVSGAVDALTIQARTATLEQVLQALRDAFKLQYRGTIASNDIITGSYSGSLPKVVARLLESQNQSYVLHGSADGLQVVIFATSGAAAKRVVGATPIPPGGEPLKECKYNGVPVEC